MDGKTIVASLDGEWVSEEGGMAEAKDNNTVKFLKISGDQV